MLTSAIDFDSFVMMMVDVREGAGVVFCPPLISLYDDNDDDTKPMGRNDDSDYIKGDFDFITDDNKKSKYVSCYEEDDSNNNDDYKHSNESSASYKNEKTEK